MLLLKHHVTGILVDTLKVREMCLAQLKNVVQTGTWYHGFSTSYIMG